jgi:hypothetical protein
MVMQAVLFQAVLGGVGRHCAPSVVMLAAREVKIPTLSAKNADKGEATAVIMVSNQSPIQANGGVE